MKYKLLGLGIRKSQNAVQLNHKSPNCHFCNNFLLLEVRIAIFNKLEFFLSFLGGLFTEWKKIGCVREYFVVQAGVCQSMPVPEVHGRGV